MGAKMSMIDKIGCTIMSNPTIETEQPFIMSFDVKIQGDVMNAMFMGEFARQLKNNIRPGDTGIIREALVERGRIAFTFMHLEPSTAIGRNVSTWG
jgi:hypothetical protein